jgi:DNA-binding MarR family transcriptional regulator
MPPNYVGLVGQQLRRELCKQAKAAGWSHGPLSKQQLMVLEQLWEHHLLSVKLLVLLTGLNHNSVVTAVRRLRHRKLVVSRTEYAGRERRQAFHQLAEGVVKQRSS